MANPSSDNDCTDATNVKREWPRFFVNRRLSNSSLDTHGSTTSARTALPQYSMAGDLPPVSPNLSVPGGLLGSGAPGVTLASRPLPVIPNIVNFPPRYSLISRRLSSQSLPNDIQEDVGRSHIEHLFPIRDNKPWATLLTFTPKSVPGLIQEPRPKSKLPRFLGSEPILGMVELDLESARTIQQITITLRGTIVSGSLVHDAHVFLEYKNILWHKSMGDPPSSSTPPDTNNGKKSQGRFLGSYQFPFNFPCPTRVNIDSYEAIIPDALSPFSLATTSSSVDTKPSMSSSSKNDLGQGSSQRHIGGTDRKHKKRLSQIPLAITGDEGIAKNWICPIPQNFVETGITASVQYELIVDIVHGFLKPNSRIKTNVSYLPCISSSLPSVKRLQAQENNALAPGPVLDPGGWFALPTSALRGQLGGPVAKPVNIDCTLYLASPLSYTRGTFIPCYLKLSSEDLDALNALSAPNSPRVRLVRRLRHLLPRGEVGVLTGDLVPVNGQSNLMTVIGEMGDAVWWLPPKDVLQEPHTHYLEGEIHLSRRLEPSCACSLFQIEYFVEMLPFTCMGFKPTAPRKGMSDVDVLSQALVAHPVNIATIYTPDTPLPVSFTKPPVNNRRTAHLRRNLSATSLATLFERVENSGGNAEYAVGWRR
ncbi:hypothetical protein GALMADRAFT_1258921 [Galerina marginata CBS 339.88]|uniref:Arrestin-like N-terminal domain-containing protein n=1 Tax=Galerina marginata (strain CBS 339.88) TaxID=685588 RepID=A0A067T665_GALM3|nr:hypothetical protein GALMADRAFT_1258921 [Galerina marginata CBS 339.88]